MELIEFPNNRDSAVCCGGSSRIWMETPPGERLFELKVGQAIDAGAEVLAVACPYCMLMFDDAVLVTGKENKKRDGAETSFSGSGSRYSRENTGARTRCCHRFFNSV
ncbi:MAG: hypothetical protein ISS61_10400 [Desulfobacteraceae bacterium]|nr:hypothetical protein [Desulfobacteraceae bacterium]